MLQKFSNLTVVDVEIIINQVRKLISQSIFAVEFLFIFCLLSGSLVLWASLASSREERIREVTILRTMGATKQQLAFSQFFELFVVGFTSGFIATLMAQLLAIGISNFVFEFEINFSYIPILLGGLVGAFFSVISGTIALRGVLETPSIKSLREVI